MPKIEYVPKSFRASAMLAIEQASGILRDYGAQGFDLTLRQIYYQFVVHDLFPEDRRWRRLPNGKWVRDPNGTKNAEPNYKWLGPIISDARLAGLLDWSYIVDRTRNLKSLAHWETPEAIIADSAEDFRVDLWATQPCYVEGWIEKDALIGVLERPCQALDIPYFSCRGYTSQSAAWHAAQRIARKTLDGRRAVIFHLGDHDPSGIDMTRDIRARFETFGVDVDIRRLALNMDQVEEHQPPPNPAKLTDSRCAGYIARYGDSSWELDALTPQTINELINAEANELIDRAAWDLRKDQIDEGRRLLQDCADRWSDVVELLDD
jgi:hypothetical protein